eukprot:g30433.t1
MHRQRKDLGIPFACPAEGLGLQVCKDAFIWPLRPDFDSNKGACATDCTRCSWSLQGHRHQNGMLVWWNLERIKSLHFGVDQLICTPGRLDDLVSKPDKFTGQSILSLSMVHYVVLDEADCMLDLGFEPQVRRLLQHVAEQRQILCFSATWPKKVQALTKELLPDAIHIKVGASDGISGNRDVEQHVRLLTGDRFQELKTILQSHPNQACIIFCALKKTAASLNRWLREESFASGAIHGNLMQQERIEVMEQFRKEELKILVATDVAARGLDLKRILVVVNYESPVSLDAHVHRVGRTGRAGQRGHAYSLLEPEDRTMLRFEE